LQKKKGKKVSLVAKVFITLVVLVIGVFGTVVASSIPPDYEYKGESALSKEDYLKLVREYDVGEYLVVLDVVDNVYEVHYNFETEEKLDVLEGGVSGINRVVCIAALVFGVLMTVALASIPWLTDSKAKEQD